MSNDSDRAPSGNRPEPERNPTGESARRLRRFYHRAESIEGADGFVLHLDGKPARTPAKQALAAPTRALGDAIASEWAAQGSLIDPGSMPLTRIANTVIDGVVANADAVRAEIVQYAGSDLLCYRTVTPPELAALQAAAWDPVLDWARETLGASFAVTYSIMPVEQPEAAIRAVADAVGDIQPFSLGPAHIITTLTGSAVTALATLKGRLTDAEAWTAAHIDEDWQISQWGEDAEAAARRERRWLEMSAATRFAALANDARASE